VVTSPPSESRNRQRCERNAACDPVTHNNGGSGGKSGAGGYPHQSRIGEGIAEQALHDGAACREQCADANGEHDPRQPDRPKNEAVLCDHRAVAIGQPDGGNDAAERNACRADHRRHRDHDK